MNEGTEAAGVTEGTEATGMTEARDAVGGTEATGLTDARGAGATDAVVARAVGGCTMACADADALKRSNSMKCV